MICNLELIAVNHLVAAIFILWRDDTVLGECKSSRLRPEGLSKIGIWACHCSLLLIRREVILRLAHNTEILYILVFN